MRTKRQKPHRVQESEKDKILNMNSEEGEEGKFTYRTKRRNIRWDLKLFAPGVIWQQEIKDWLAQFSEMVEIRQRN